MVEKADGLEKLVLRFPGTLDNAVESQILSKIIIIFFKKYFMENACFFWMPGF